MSLVPASANHPVEAFLTDARLAPYRQACDGDPGQTLPLYQWSAKTSVAAFEIVGHLEVLLRNAVDRELRRHAGEDRIGIPWFLMPLKGGNIDTTIAATRSRLRDENHETRDQIVAGLSFGFWTGLLGIKYEQLWRDALHLAFPHSSGRRKEVASAVSSIRVLRNRLAHHDSLLRVDIPFEIERVLRVAGWIDPDAGTWLRQLSTVMDIYKERPAKLLDTVVVPAADAWELYLQEGVYVCQPRRAFRPVERIAFYADKEIKPQVPKIKHRRDLVEWSPQSQARLASSADRNDRQIAKAIGASRLLDWTQGVYQIFLLTRPADQQAGHRTLPHSIPHATTGRGSAFVQRQRYVSLHALETAATTADLL